MGEFLGNDEDATMNDYNASRVGVDADENGFETDVDGVKADGFVQKGTEKFPRFDVDRNTFYSNSHDERRRMRFKSGSSVQQYMQGTKYRRPFYISFKDDNGRRYTKKIK
ncbi:MAG: hypothetical protein ACOC56_02180 [Atribacterota bacterium]